MNKGTLFLIFILVVLVAGLSYAAVLQSVKAPSEPIATVAPTPTPDPSLLPQTTLTASPSAALVKVGAVQTIDIIADSGDNVLTTVQLELSYDPKFIDVEAVTPGAFFENASVLLNNLDKTTGRIVLALGSVTPKKGQGILATITIRGRAPTATTGKTTDITFLPKTQILGNASENLTSLLRKTTSAQLVITSQ